MSSSLKDNKCNFKQCEELLNVETKDSKSLLQCVKMIKHKGVHEFRLPPLERLSCN